MWKIKTTAQSTSDSSQKHQTSEIYLKTSDLMLKHQKWQHWPTPPWRDLKCIVENLLPCYCYVTKANSRTIRCRVSQPASACYQNSEPDSCAVWVSYRQTNCRCKN